MATIEKFEDKNIVIAFQKLQDTENKLEEKTKELDELEDKLEDEENEKEKKKLKRKKDKLEVELKNLEKRMNDWNKHVMYLQKEAIKFNKEKDIESKLIEISGKLDAMKEDKKGTISISRVTQKQFRELFDDLGLVRRTITFSVIPTSKHVEPFKWDDSKEDAQSTSYMEWLNRNIILSPNVQFYKTSSIMNLLSTTNASLRYNINGTLDTAIIDEKNIKSGNIAGGLRVGLEHKKEVCDHDALQAMLELISASIYSEYPPVIVLTDLGQIWKFFWLEIGTIIDCTFDLKEAINIIESIASEADAATSANTFMQDAPYKTRYNFRDAIFHTRKDDEALSRDKEVEGLNRILKRPKIDPFDLLPENDIAPMQDVFDVMEEDEIHNWKLKKVLDFVSRTPAFQSSLLGENWRSMYA